MRGLRTLKSLVAGAALVAAAGACASSGPPIARLGPSDLYDRAVREYESENWNATIRALERLTVEYPTHPRIEDARFYLADAYFGNEEYITAAEEFVRFANEFGISARAAEARFRTCEAYRELSPDVQLDQRYTRAAVEHCQALVQYYPDSEYTPRAREIAQTMRDKLGRKVFIGGEFYFERQAYDSAIVYYEQVIADHPDAAVVPDAMLRLVQIYDRLGYVEEAEQARERLISRYPDSSQADRARSIAVASGS